MSKEKHAYSNKTKMALLNCNYCRKEWEFTTATIARNKKTAHMKT
jgi:hypothetical protein